MYRDGQVFNESNVTYTVSKKVWRFRHILWSSQTPFKWQYELLSSSRMDTKLGYIFCTKSQPGTEKKLVELVDRHCAKMWLSKLIFNLNLSENYFHSRISI